MKADRSKTWKQIAKEELAGKRHGFTSFDEVIARYDELKRGAESAAREQENYRRKVLIPLAKKEGFRKGTAFLLAGAHNSALIERVLDIFITDQAAARALPASLRRRWLAAIFKPTDELKKLMRERHLGDPRGLVQFLNNAVKTRRHWRVARVSVRAARVGAARPSTLAGARSRKKAA